MAEGIEGKQIKKETTTTKTSMVSIRPPSILPFAFVGVLTGLDNYLYAYGVAGLPVIIALQLTLFAVKTSMVSIRPPSILAFAFVGVLTDLDNYLYAYGVAGLPVIIASNRYLNHAIYYEAGDVGLPTRPLQRSLPDQAKGIY
ncbi:hypothetical protein RIF29_11944 [Crotalaria pallida]|uniref:Uncharacterized protein n=1 Tax=Crotalaria pallida TaxID=3830 RepID=A0AAN9P0H9_CROPI